MVTYTEHAGGCCGVKTIYGFDGSTLAELDNAINAVHTPGNSNRLIEIVLSERQVTGDPHGVGGWPAALATRGFRLVSRFRNSNSGRICYVFHKVPAFLPLTDLPFNYPANLKARYSGQMDTGTTAPTPAPIPAPPVVRVVRSLYANVFSDGRRGAMYQTYGEAEANRGRRARIDRYDVSSDGTAAWVNNVTGNR